MVTSVRAAGLNTAAGSAAVRDPDEGDALRELTAQLRDRLAGRAATFVLYLCTPTHRAQRIVPGMAAAFPEAIVMGCSTAGEFTDLTNSIDGLVGLVLIDGVSNAEEVVNERLNAAALDLDVVGGSAGDNLGFERTWVAVGGELSYRGVALAVVHSRRPYHRRADPAFDRGGGACHGRASQRSSDVQRHPAPDGAGRQGPGRAVPSLFQRHPDGGLPHLWAKSGWDI